MFDVVLRLCGPGGRMLTSRGVAVALVYGGGTRICAPEVAACASSPCIASLMRLPIQRRCFCFLARVNGPVGSGSYR